MKRPSRTLYVLVMVVVSYCLTTASAGAKLDGGAVVADQLPQVEAPTRSKTGGNTGLRWQRAAVARPETVRVRPGDSLSSIAESVLGNVRGAQIERFVARLYRHNRRVIGNDPDLIRPGQVLRLPRIGHGEASSRRAQTAQVSAPSRGLNLGRLRAIGLSELRADHKVRVRRGDTLWSIVDDAVDALLSPSELRKVARYKPLVGGSNLPALVAVAAQSSGGHSGSSVEQFVDRVYRANRSVIGPDPDIIQPGQVIELPMFEGSPVLRLDQGLGSLSPDSIHRLSRSNAGLSELVKEVGMIAGLSAKSVRTCCSGPERVSTNDDDDARETALGFTAQGAITPLASEHSKNERDLAWIYPAATGILVALLLSALRSAPAGRHSIRRRPEPGSRRRLGFTRPKGMGT